MHPPSENSLLSFELLSTGEGVCDFFFLSHNVNLVAQLCFPPSPPRYFFQPNQIWLSPVSLVVLRMCSAPWSVRGMDVLMFLC